MRKKSTEENLRENILKKKKRKKCNVCGERRWSISHVNPARSQGRLQRLRKSLSCGAKLLAESSCWDFLMKLMVWLPKWIKNLPTKPYSVKLPVETRYRELHIMLELPAWSILRVRETTTTKRWKRLPLMKKKSKMVLQLAFHFPICIFCVERIALYLYIKKSYSTRLPQIYPCKD